MKPLPLQLLLSLSSTLFDVWDLEYVPYNHEDLSAAIIRSRIDLRICRCSKHKQKASKMQWLCMTNFISKRYNTQTDLQNIKEDKSADFVNGRSLSSFHKAH